MPSRPVYGHPLYPDDIRYWSLVGTSWTDSSLVIAATAIIKTMFSISIPISSINNRAFFLLQCFIALMTLSQGESDVEHPECRLYLAESTIPGAGLGIFTGIDLKPEEAVAEPDIVIPFHDQLWHAGDDMDFWNLWNEYSWQSGEVGMDYDFMEGQALVIGTGCMPNCNWALINAREGKPSYSHAGLHRSVDPGISGFTGYHNQKMFTVRSVPAGGELFVSYGEQWFTDREEDIGPIPFIGSYDNVDKFLKKRFKKISLKHHTAAGDSNFTRDLWNVIKSIPYETRNVNALPLSFEDMQLAQHIGSAESRLPYSVRTLDWLMEHGRCMDNIRPGISTIKQAGRGAFASRFIPEGGLVAPGPLLHIANRTALNIYEMDPTGNRDPSNQIGMQLVLNYCFGNKQSTVILCPYTSPSAYINHSSKSPNVKVVWSKDSTPNHNPGWLEEDVKFLKRNGYIGLSIDFIATRDIQPGEEVFLDYGPEWDEAWNDYMKKWTPPPDSDEYIPAASIEEPYRTEEEELLNPYSDNIVFYCAYGYEQGMPEGVYRWEDQWYELFAPYPCEVESREAGGVDSDGNTIYFYDVVMLDESGKSAFVLFCPVLWCVKSW